MGERVCRLVIITTDSLTSQARAFIGVNVCTLRVSELNCVSKKEKKDETRATQLYIFDEHALSSPWTLVTSRRHFIRTGWSKLLTHVVSTKSSC